MARQVIDFTKMRKGSKPRRLPIDYCPKCKRKGEVHTYPNGDMMYVHKMRMGIVPIAWEIFDSCHIKGVRT